jgi:hypothetical protein
MQGHDDAAARLRALLDEPPGEAEALARSWVARGEALSVRALFPELLRSIVEESDDASLLGGLRALTSLARGGHAGARMMSQELALNVEVFSRVPYERLVELYALAIDAGAPDVAQLFLSNRPKSRGTVEEAGAIDNEHVPLPLGVRKAAARTRDRMLLDKLLRDRNPQVISTLLNNPWLRERDVVLVAALRPTLPAVLQVVASHPKWSTRYAVRKALACNPYCPSALALRLIGTLFRQVVAFIASSSALSDEVLTEARRLLTAG